MPVRPPENIRELLETQVERSPEREFLFLESNGRVFTYRGFDDEVNRAMSTLHSLGVSKGDRVTTSL